MSKLETFEGVHQNYKNEMKMKMELDTTGFSDHREDITREELIEKYGKDLVESIDESHCDGWLEVVNDFDNTLFAEYHHLIPMGLEKKISLGWFMHFFSWMNEDSYSVDIEGGSFHGNWLDVPYPYADEIFIPCVFKRDLPDPCYNWYELFLIIDEMMWKGGRCLDIGITSVGCVMVRRVSEDPDGHPIHKKVIEVGWSS